MILLTGNRNKKQDKRFLWAFTLAELLLSVVILSFGLVAIIGTYLTAANALDSSQNRLQAVEFLQEKLGLLEEEVVAQNDILPTNEEITLNNRPATYNLEVSDLPAAEGVDLGADLNLVELSLSWKERNVDKDVSIFSYLEKKPEVQPE